MAQWRAFVRNMFVKVKSFFTIHVLYQPHFKVATIFKPILHSLNKSPFHIYFKQILADATVISNYASHHHQAVLSPSHHLEILFSPTHPSASTAVHAWRCWTQHLQGNRIKLGSSGEIKKSQIVLARRPMDCDKFSRIAEDLFKTESCEPVWCFSIKSNRYFLFTEHWTMCRIW